MGCCPTCAKVILIATNILFALAGIALAGVGGACLFAFDTVISMISKVEVFQQILEVVQSTGSVDLIKNSAIFLLVLGLVLLIIGCLGVLGAFNEVVWMLGVFLVLVGVIFAAQLGLIIYAVVDKEGLQNMVNNALLKTLPNYQGNGLSYQNGTLFIADKDSNQASFAWDFVQIYSTCCGVNGTNDWTERAAFNASYWLPGDTTVPAQFPLSCCKVTEGHRNKYPAEVQDMTFHDAESCLTTGFSNTTNTQGCVNVIFEAIWEFGVIPAGVICGIMALQLLDIICALIIICQAGKENQPV